MKGSQKILRSFTATAWFPGLHCREPHLCTRMPFFAIEIARTRGGSNKAVSSVLGTKKERKEPARKTRKLRKEPIVEEKRRKASTEKERSRKLTREEEKKAKKPAERTRVCAARTAPFGSVTPLCKWRTQTRIFLASKRSYSGHKHD